jgi:TolB-like protein/DNA-binding winged helix-turn-helix (wHTH) protein/Flp pilus assembly protein TadD
MSSLASSLYAFGEFQVDAQNRTLRRGAEPVALTPKAFEVLLLLIDRGGELVSKDELMEKVWPDSFVEESNLTQTVFMLRKALGETSKQRYILTIQGRGYRFAPDVKSLHANGDVPGASLSSVVQHPDLQVATGKQPPAGRIRRQMALGFGLFAVVAAGLSVWLLPALSRPTNPSSPIQSIAVLPLENLSGDPSQDYFADAMTDELITNLAKIGALRVTSRTTVTLYKHTRKSLPEIAHELNVDAVVEGSVVRSGQRVRVTAQLIRASADQHLWAETYERDLGDALRLQSDVAGAIAQQVRAQLTTEQQAQFRSAQAVDPQAYDAYLKGSYYLYNSPITVPGPLNQAKTYFEEAVRRDPTFSKAYSGLANAYIYLSIFGQAQISSVESYKYAKEADRKALQLDPNNGEAYEVLGVLNWRSDFDWYAADRAFSRSLALSPSYSCAHEDRAVFLAFMGRRAEALAEVEKSTQVDPSATWLESAVYFQLRDWPRMVESGLRGVASNPNDWPAHARLGTGFEGTGKLPEAIAEYQKANDLSNGDFDTIASLGHAYAAIGRRAQAEAILRGLAQKAKEGRASPYFAATIYAGLGNKDKAFQLIDQAYREKSFDIAWVLKPDLRTDNLRSDPRFQDLLHRTGLTQ